MRPRVIVQEPLSNESLYRAHSARVLRLCVVLLADQHEAEDVAQEVFIKLFRERELQSGPVEWAAWLTRVTVNACHDRRRSGWWKWWRNRGLEIEELDLPNGGFSPEEETLRGEQQARVWRSLGKLPLRQREIVALRMLEGYSTAEVADQLGLSPGTVKRHLFRAVQSLRKSLASE